MNTNFEFDANFITNQVVNLDEHYVVLICVITISNNNKNNNKNCKKLN